jgi:hypothetical protein
MAIRKSSNSGIPFGNNAGRPASPSTGQPYFNGEAARLELYTSNNSWENIVQEVPGVSSISGSYLESQQSNIITIYGTNFVSGAVAYAIGSDAVQVPATSTTFNSLVQLTAVFTGLTSENEPYDIKVQNPSNLFGLLPDALYVNNILTWNTPAGSLGAFQDNVSMSVSATASDDSTIAYSLAEGSSLPSGLSLNSQTGLISGNIGDIVEDVTYTFTINASDGSNPTVPRTFSITFNAAPIWSTASGSLGTFAENSSISITLAATDFSDSITYSLAPESSLPNGITLNSSTGVISGVLPEISENTTYSFTINASDSVNTVSRSFSIDSLDTVPTEYLVVAGGGGSGSQRRGGGGAGGMLTGTLLFTKTLSLSVTVGAGGASNTTQTKVNGENSVLDSLIAIGGGGGAGDSGGSTNANGNDGGSGCGGLGDAAPYGLGGQGVPGQGNNGGSGQGSTAPYYGAGGGGGAGAAGGNGNSNGVAGNGGDGLQSSITGTATYYAGGGGGGYYNLTSGIRSSGGLGGGGRGGANGVAGENGAANTGGGGGGGYNGGTGTTAGGSGGSGVVVIAYPNSYPALSNISAGLTYDQPTRSGYRVYRFTAGTGTITF